MYYKSVILGLLTAVVVVLSGCKNEESELIMTLSTIDKDWRKEYFDSDSHARIQIYAKSHSSQIRHIVVSSYDPSYQRQILLDTVYADPIKRINDELIWHIPPYKDTTLVELKGTAYSVAGDVCNFTISLYVIPQGGGQVRTIDGITLYSALSGGKSCFSLETMTTTAADSLGMQGLWFADKEPASGEDQEKMSCEWYSTSVYFSRFESFDYSEATVMSIRDAYDNSKHDRTISNIHNDDIILVGTAGQAIGAIKVLMVADEAGTATDRYIFSLKAIQ